MEYIELVSLRTLIDHNKKGLKIQIIQAIAKNLLLAIQSLHQQNICHRDIWPKNIMCSIDGTQLKLIDLGVSRKFDSKTDELMLTQTGCFAYRAPEIIKNEQYK